MPAALIVLVRVGVAEVGAVGEAAAAAAISVETSGNVHFSKNISMYKM
jgi:hypothetical protein